MKKLIIIATFICLYTGLHAQDANTQLQTTVTKLDNAVTVKDYQQFATDFLRIADAQKTQWLPYSMQHFVMQRLAG